MGLFKKESAESTAQDLARTEQNIKGETARLLTVEEEIRDLWIKEARDIAKELVLLKALNADVEKLVDTASAQKDLGDLEKPTTGLAFQLFLLSKHFLETGNRLVKTEQFKSIGESALAVAKAIDAARNDIDPMTRKRKWPYPVQKYGVRGFREWLLSLLHQKRFFSLLSERYSSLTPKLDVLNAKISKSVYRPD